LPDTSPDNINDLCSGETWNFKVVYVGMDAEDVASYDIAVGSGFNGGMISRLRIIARSPKLLQVHDTIINFNISVVGWITPVPRPAICQLVLRVKLW